MKKVLCLIDTLGMGGGAERQMAGLAGLLHMKGFDVTVATYYSHDSDDFLSRKYGIKSVLIRTGSSPLSKLLTIRKYLKEYNFDTLIVYKDGATMLACILKMMGGNYRLIVSERNTTQVLNMHERLKFYLYKWADFIVPNSESQGNFIKQNYPCLESKVCVITNFTDTNYFKPSKELKINEKPIKILITARISRQKNVLGFLDVVKKLKNRGANIKISWFGSVYTGQVEYGKECEKRYKELFIDDILTFHPATNKIVYEYQACDIFCLPSYYEGYPNVICEAMSCGKPILCSRVCDNLTLVKDGVNGFMFDPTNVDDMVEKIEKMCYLPKVERSKMGELSREIAEERFSEEVFVNKYIKLLES